MPFTKVSTISLINCSYNVHVGTECHFQFTKFNSVAQYHFGKRNLLFAYADALDLYLVPSELAPHKGHVLLLEDGELGEPWVLLATRLEEEQHPVVAFSFLISV